MERRTRRSIRLREYDYSRPGYYFITICAKNREWIFGSVCVGRDDLGAPVVNLTPYGEIVERYINSIATAYSNVEVEKYVIMPNHLHVILRIKFQRDGAPGSSRPTQMVPRIIATLKRFVNKEIGENIWQTSYHDHIIRNEADYLRIWEYIDTNPARWTEDRYYCEEMRDVP